MTLISSEIWPPDEVCRHTTDSHQWTGAGPTQRKHSYSTAHEGGSLTGILKAENPRSRENKGKDRKKKKKKEDGVGTERTMDKEGGNSRN